MNKDIKANNNEAEAIKNVGETELNDVAGGTEAGETEARALCRFVPEMPTQHKREGGKVWVLCSSGCGFSGHCKCHGSPRCVNRWHEMEMIAEGLWAPYPLLEYNHSKGDKAVRDIPR